MKLMLVRRRDGVGLVDADEGAFICRLDFGSPYGEKLMALEAAARALVESLNRGKPARGYQIGYWFDKELAALEAVLGKETT